MVKQLWPSTSIYLTITRPENSPGILIRWDVGGWVVWMQTCTLAKAPSLSLPPTDIAPLQRLSLRTPKDSL